MISTIFLRICCLDQSTGLIPATQDTFYKYGGHRGRSAQIHSSLSIQWHVMVRRHQSYHSNIGLICGRLLEKDYFADFEIHCGEHIFKVHRAVIIQGCEYFKTLTASSFKEGTERKVVFEEDEPAVIARYDRETRTDHSWLCLAGRYTFCIRAGCLLQLLSLIWKSIRFAALMSRSTKINQVFIVPAYMLPLSDSRSMASWI